MEAPFPVVLEAIERLLEAQPVELCAGCRVLLNRLARYEYHQRSCPFSMPDTETEIASYDNLVEADAAGPVYRIPMEVRP